MRIALVGPTHPYKGGVAAHTTQTAHRLAAAGHELDLISWSRLYPAVLYPGEQAVPDGGPDLPPYPRTVRPLRWDRPGTWWRTGARLRGYDLVILVTVVPAQVPALLTLLRAARGRSGGSGRPAGSGAARPTGDASGGRPRTVVLAHNVVPHESHPGASWLIERLLRAADGVLVHSAEQARLAAEHGARHVVSADLPPHLPGGAPDPEQRAELVAAAAARAAAGAPVRVLALGMVRAYKGFDLLLEAAGAVPGVRLTIAGEQWGRAGERVRELAADPRLAGRVELRPGYVPGPEVPALVGGHDVLALPYRSATASQNVLLARAYGLPVLATRVGTFPDQVRDGVDGLLVPPSDVEALAGALRELADPMLLAKLRTAVPAPDLDGPWRDYGAALLAAAGLVHDPGPAGDPDPSGRDGGGR